MRRRYALHGLSVASDLPIAAVPSTAPPDVVIVRGDKAPPTIVGKPTVVAGYPDGFPYRVVERGSGFLLSFAEVLAAEIAPDGKHVRVHPAKPESEAWASVLLSGTVMAFVAILQNMLVLHASAVEVDRATLAFIGASGTGKSTVAALACANGAQLVADDVLAVDAAANEPRCYPGNIELRLRPAAASLAEFFPLSARTETADRRVGVRLPADARPRQLGALAIPRPSRTAASLEIERVDPGEALVEALRFPRIAGLTGELRARQFQRLATLIRQVPTYRLTIPWGPPFPEDVRHALQRFLRSVSGTQP